MYAMSFPWCDPGVLCLLEHQRRVTTEHVQVDHEYPVLCRLTVVDHPSKEH